MERDMDQAKTLNRHEETGRQLARKFSRANSSKKRCLIPVKRKPHLGIIKTLDGQGDVRDKVEAREPSLVQLNLKASLMGVKIYGDKDHFFSRQSSMSSSKLSDKFRSGVAIPCCNGGVQGRPSIDGVEKKHRGISIVASSKPPHINKRAQNGSNMGDNRSRLDTHLSTSPSEKNASGVLYPSPQVGNNANSSILNAVHFTFGDATADGCGHVTEKIYKQLLGQSRLEKWNDDGGLGMIHQTHSSSSTAAKTDKYSDAVSTLEPPVSCSSSLTFSERLFGYEFSRDSPQRPSQPDLKSAPSTKLGPNFWQLNSQLGQHSMSIPATSDYEDTDDDDIILENDIIFEVPNGIALHCSHDQRHYAELVMVGDKPRPKCERWSSSKQSFNLELGQQPIKKKAMSINVHRNRQHQSSNPGRSVSARSKLDVSHRDITCMSSLNSSFNGGSRRLKKGTPSSFRSDRSGWLEFESEMNDFVLDSGRLKIDMKYEPDFDNPDLFNSNLEQVDNGVNKFQDDGAKMDEEDFPFNSPIASTFVFGDGLKKCSEDAQQHILNTSLSSMRRTVIVETHFDNNDLDHSDAYHDPDDGSVSDTDSSLTTFSLEADSIGQPSLWVSTRSFNYLREVVDHNSGFLDIESRSGRFSVDLRQDKILGRVDHPPRPGMRISIMKTEKPSSRRSLLSPCLAPMVASRRFSCTTWLCPIAKAASKLQYYDIFTAQLGHAGADSSRLQVINCFSALLGQTAETADDSTWSFRLLTSVRVFKVPPILTA